MSTSRHNFYACIHKGIRRELSELVRGAAHVDFAAPEARARYLDRLRASLTLMSAHATHEDHHIEPLIESFAPALARRIAATHRVLDEQEHTVLAAAEHAHDRVSGHALYLAVTRYAATQLGHMADEESEVMAVLWAHMSDVAILAVEHAIVESCTPAENAVYLEWMLRGVNEAEEAELLAGLRAGAPAEVVAYAEQIASDARRQRAA